MSTTTSDTSPSRGTTLGRSSPADRPNKRSRTMNCAECRRLKIKCDRNIPCGSCVKKGYAHLCPERASEGLKDIVKERDDLASRIKDLENMLGVSGLPNPIHIPEPSIMLPDPAPPAPSSVLPMAEDRGRSIPGVESIFQPPFSLPSPSIANTSVLGVVPDSRPMQDPGTLVAVPGRRYIYVGPSAETQFARADLLRNTSPSPSGRDPPNADRGHIAARRSLEAIMHPQLMPYSTLRSKLPSMTDALMLTDSYFRRVAWAGTPISRSDFMPILERVYGNSYSEAEEDTNRCMELALVSAALALGSVMDMEREPLDGQALDYVILAQQCLFAGQYMIINSLTCLEALCLLAKALTYVDVYRRWDYAWQLLGVAERIIQAMGLHRDGHVWKLNPEEVEQRRRIFWDVYITDVFMSMNWDRLTGLPSYHYDTLYPESWVSPISTFDVTHAELARLTKEALDTTHNVHPRAFEPLGDIWRKTCLFEDQMPFKFRCRQALRAMVSKYATYAEADGASPPPDRSDIALTFQQHYLIIKSSATIISLLRVYYVAALKESPSDPTRSQWTGAFLCVIERSSMIVAALESLQKIFRLLALRHWTIWSHGFSAAACLAVFILVAPSSSLVPLALRDLRTFLSILPSLRSHLPRETFRKDVEWLESLYDTILNSTPEALSQDPANTIPSPQTRTTDPEEAEKHLQLLGWRRRLIKRAGVEDTTPQQVSTEIDTQADTAFDPSFWFQSWPEPDCQIVLGGASGVVGEALSSSDLLQQMLNWHDNDT